VKIVKRDIPGIDLYYVPIKKFKTIEAFFVFTNEVDPTTFNEKNFLTEILLDSTNKYPSTEKFKLVCDNLYGLGKVNHYHFEGNLDITMFIISSVSDKYLGEEKIFSQAFDVLLEIIYNPKTYNGLIPKKAAKEKLMQTKELLLSLKQNKNAYSYYQFMKTYTRNNTDHITFFPETKYLDQVTSETINATYQKMINEDHLQIFIGGDFDFEEMDDLIKSKISRIKLHDSKKFTFRNHFKTGTELNEVIDKTSTGQTRIFIGYDLGFVHTQKNGTIMALFNELFGAFENSKLFSNIREKLNLSYYVYSYYSPGNDLFFVNLETSKDNLEKAIAEVSKQLLDCQNGLIDDDLFNQAKKNLINRLETSVDSQYKLLIYNVIDFIRYNEAFDLEKRKEAIENIKMTELIDLIKTIKIDTTYIYTSGE